MNVVDNKTMKGDHMIMLAVLSAASMLMLYYGSLMTPTEVYLPISPSTLRHSRPEPEVTTTSTTSTPKLRADANICCQADTPICKACHEGISVEEYLKKQPRIMIGIPLHNRRGYVKFHSKVVTQYNNINSKDIFIFDDASTEYDEVQLRKWYGKDIHYFRSTTRLKADKNTRALFTHFAKSNYDILLTLDSDLILDNQWKQFIYGNIDKSGVLSLYHSNIGHHKTFNCNGNICQKRSMGNAGAVMTKSIVIEMLKHHTSPMFDWGWVAYFKKRGINMYVPKNSLVLHYGKIGQNNGCNTRELAKGFNRSILPSWIKTRLVFYFDKCSSPSMLFKEEPELIVIVLSKRDAFTQRQVIRETWKTGHDNVFFIVGNPCMVPNPEPWTCNGKKGDINYIKQQNKITEKLKKEKDVVFVDMIDVYRNLAQKLKLAYDWVYKTYGKQYVLKVDLDTFVRVSSVEHFLKNRNKKYECIVGNTQAGKVPRGGKWAEHKYKKQTYPPLPSGSGHIVSPDLLEYIVTHEFTFYQGEDTSLGIFIDEHKLKNVFTTTPHMTTHSGYCLDNNKFVIGHNINPSGMRKCYKYLDELANTPVIYHDGSIWASKTAEYINIKNIPIKVYNGISTDQDIYLHMYWEPHPPKYKKTMKAKQIFIYGEASKPPVTDIRILGNTDEEFYYVQQVYSTLTNRKDIFTTRSNTGKKFMKYVFTNCVKHRETVYDMISSQIQPVDALGACKSPDGKRKGKWWDKTNKDYKFIIAMESSKHPHYITEKILLAFMSGAIPIYWGSENVFKLFNKDAFVYFDIDNPEKSISLIKKLSTDKKSYKEMLEQPILVEGAYDKYFSREALHNIIYKKESFLNMKFPSNIFLDVGSNRGDVIEAFFNKRHRRDSTNPAWKFPINPYDPEKWKVVGFEASPSHVKTLSKWDKRNNVKIIFNAAWTNNNETVRLNVDDGKNGAGHAEWGSSLFLDWSKRNDWMKGTGKYYDVKTMDFIAFLRNNIKQTDTVVMKMNIEGTEFKILQAMKKFNLLCLIDYYQMYWHPSFFDDSNEKKIIVADIRIEILKCKKSKISLWSVH